jgi:serine/threonine protein kinase
MATGGQAFSGSTSAIIFDALLHSTPPLPSQVNPAASAQLDQIITKLLEKDPELRYQTAADLHADLKRLHRDTTSNRSAAQAAGYGDSLGPGKLPTSASPGARLLFRDSPRACQSPNPAPPRPYPRFVARPAFIDSSDRGISVK